MVALAANIAGAQERALTIIGARERTYTAAALVDACTVVAAALIDVAVEGAEPARPLEAGLEAAIITLDRPIASRADRARDIRGGLARAEEREQQHESHRRKTTPR
jgi:hypothetical protein